MTDTTGPKKTRRTKKATVKEVEVSSKHEQEPSNQPATSRTDDPRKSRYLGAYSSRHDSRDPGVDNG